MEPDLASEQLNGLADDCEEVRALVALSLVPGVGPGRIRALVGRFGSVAAALSAPPSALAEVPGVGLQTAEAIARFDADADVREQLDSAERAGAEIITAWDDRFPHLLRQIYDPPAFLWVRGELLPEDERAIAIVGTRRPTDYGKQAAADFAAGLVQHGFTIVSGLAYGIDVAAHRAALEAGGRTISVLGSGVDRIYPSKHERVARSIIEQGAVVSEFALGAAPEAPNFPRRNRVVSGLSLGTLVVEAYEGGGALITARLAVEQNREVFAVPSPVRSKAGAGTNRLIQQGHAKLVMTVEDILAELGVPEPVSTPKSEAPAPAPPDLNGVERRLFDALTEEPVHIDTLCLRADLDTSTALVYLLSLEFKGLVRQMAGKQFFRA
ncbi:MAG TPA: DNA-processing protein DprA [Rhodothermales bacterium]|nr:DNA-processing protein DprA [Rhodothermales bacterium]